MVVSRGRRTVGLTWPPSARHPFRRRETRSIASAISRPTSTPGPTIPSNVFGQQTYLRALRTIPHLTIYLGSYLEKPTRMPLHPPPATGPKTVQVMKSEEKGSDVNLACYLLVDAFDDDYEAAVVVSNDSDLAVPIRLVRQKFKKKVLVLHPCGPGRAVSVELRRVASKSLIVDASLLPASQFPTTLTDANGTIHKPARW